MWTCDSCGSEVDQRRILCPSCGNGAPFADPGTLALAVQRDLVMEAHLRALGIWYRVGAIACGVGALALYVGTGALALSSHASPWGLGLGGVTAWLASFMLAIGCGSWALGVYLGRFVNGARITAGVLVGLGIALNLVRGIAVMVMVARLRSEFPEAAQYGPSLIWPLLALMATTAWSICVLWALFNQRSVDLCSNRYRTIVARTPELQPQTFKSPFFVVPAFFVSLGLLFVMFSVFVAAATRF